ncbi:MAG TPA: ATP-binding protein [Bryobacteraceae bacterium]|nr:ATP-binding protein [Bryobacteraceae bacterium]
MDPSAELKAASSAHPSGATPAAHEPDGPHNARSDDPDLQRLHGMVQNLSYALHGLSHDIREPIRMVVCYSELLAQSAAIQNDPNLSEYLHFITGAAQRMDTIVNGLLAYSRLVGQEPLYANDVDMNSVVQTALANLQLKIEESGATIVCDSLPLVMGDYVQLVELVQNLLANSMKYRSAAPPQIRIHSEHSQEGYVFSIEDNGIGIEPRYCESIFSPFKRLHGQDVPGAGLGLAICWQIIQLHRGRIWVESTPGQGSTFRFVLAARAL